jgi:hypothetical protein
MTNIGTLHLPPTQLGELEAYLRTRQETGMWATSPRQWFRQNCPQYIRGLHEIVLKSPFTKTRWLIAVALMMKAMSC